MSEAIEIKTNWFRFFVRASEPPMVFFRAKGDRNNWFEGVITPAEARQIANALNALADLQEGT